MRRQVDPATRRAIASIAWPLRQFGAGWAEALECASNVIATVVLAGVPVDEALAGAISHRRRHFSLRLSDDCMAVAVATRSYWRARALEERWAA
jgi:hypothetical protein